MRWISNPRPVDQIVCTLFPRARDTSCGYVGTHSPKKWSSSTFQNSRGLSAALGGYVEKTKQKRKWPRWFSEMKYKPKSVCGCLNRNSYPGDLKAYVEEQERNNTDGIGSEYSGALDKQISGKTKRSQSQRGIV